MKSKFLSLFLAVLLGGTMLLSSPLYAQTPADSTAQTAGSDAGGAAPDANAVAGGKAIFEANCKQCHAVHEQIVGPKLAGVYDRQSEAWLINFIKYPQKTIESGDAHAVELYNQYKQFMPNHDFLKDEEIKSILAYIKDETAKGPQTAAATPVANADGTAAAAAPQSSGLFMGIIAGLVVVLTLVLTVLALLVGVLSKYLSINKKASLNEADHEVLEQKFDFKAMLRSQAFVGLVAVLFVGISGRAILDGLITIGVQQGYAPEQPIPFSHKLHAGEYEIACQYCHTGVEKGKSANIPSLNICMNCHNSIKTTSPNMQKIYDYIEKDEPIQWVRVHNLPDHAYFNHAQHVKVAGLDCTNCHGDVAKMEVVQQQSLLTMGWCIDCHRQTDVNTKGNAYYDKLVELHASKSKKPMKVEDIGGLECGKCHY